MSYSTGDNFENDISQVKKWEKHLSTDFNILFPDVKKVGNTVKQLSQWIIKISLIRKGNQNISENKIKTKCTSVLEIKTSLCFYIWLLNNFPLPYLKPNYFTERSSQCLSWWSLWQIVIKFYTISKGVLTIPSSFE